jgi:Putative Ig domain/IPT/TIG domain
MPYTVQLSMASGSDWFAPSFVTHADQVAATQVAPLANDPNLIGYFTDSELVWGPNEDNSQSLLNQYLELPAGSPGLAVAEQYPNDPNGFVTALATRYFSVTSAALHMYDPNHLNLGVKAESNDIPPELLEVASNYVDAFSIDDYALQPGDAAAAVEAFPHYLPLEPNFANFEALVHKPIIIAEYSFRATGPNTPNTVPSILATYPTQQARAAAYSNYIGTMYQSAPWVVGDDWFEYVDEPKGGRFDGENNNFGLVSTADVPYAPMVQATTLLHAATPDKAISSGPECDSWATSSGGTSCASVMPAISEPLTMVTDSLTTADVQLPYTATVVVAGGQPTYAFSVSQGQLPTGLTLDPQTGVISGTPQALGTFNFTVQATDSSGGPATTSEPLSLTVIQTELSDPVPTVTSLAPSLGVGAGGGTITINGTGFTQGLAGPTSVQFGTKPATNVVVNATGTQLTATIPAAVANGTVSVSVSTPGGSTGPAGQYTYIFSQPSVSAIAPASGAPGGGTVVTITGNAFIGATSVRFAGSAATFVVNSNSSITATSPAGTGGSAADITVTGPGGTSATSSADLFTYGPTVTGLSPNTGPRLGGTTVTIRGTGFSGATSVAFGSTPASRFSVSSSTLITAVSPPGSAAIAPVTVTTPGGTSPQTAFDTFSYIAAPPSVTGLSPAVGPPGGGTAVTITGGSFTGATTVSFGANPATSFTVNSATSITATAPAGAAATVVGVTVTGPGGTSAVGSSDHYTYGPVVTLVSPNTGSHLGRTTVTIKGAGFSGATAVSFGTAAVTSGFTVNSTGTQITVAAPAGVAGTVDITVTVGGVKTTTSVVDQYTYV